MKKIIIGTLVGLSLSISQAAADYIFRDGNGVLQTMKSLTCCGTTVQPQVTLVDQTNNPLGTVGNPIATTATFVGTITANQGTAGSSPWPVTVSGSVAVTGAFYPYTLGQKTMSASVPVTIASDQTAIPVSVSGSSTVNVVQPDVRAVGQSINSAVPSAAVTVPVVNGEGSASFSVVGLTASGATLTIEGSDDGGSTWFAANGVAGSTGTLFTTFTTDQSFRVNAGGRTNLRLRVSSVGSGTISVAYNVTVASSLTVLSSPIPSGANLIGAVNLGQVGGSSISIGQQAMAASLPVVLPSNPDSRPTSGNLTNQDTATSTTTGQNGVTIITGAPTAGSSYSQAINGQSSMRANVSGTWTGTLAFEISADGGATWVSFPMRVVGTVYTQASITGNGLFYGDVSGATNVRIRSTAVQTGAATVQVDFSAVSGAVQVLNPIRLYDNASGAAATVKAASTAAQATDPALVVAVSPNNPITATSTPNTAAVTKTAFTAGVSSAQALAGGSRKYLKICNESTGNFIAYNFGASAALNTAGNKTMVPYQCDEYADSFVPNDAVNIIASGASTPVTVLSN